MLVESGGKILWISTAVDVDPLFSGVVFKAFETALSQFLAAQFARLLLPSGKINQLIESVPLASLGGLLMLPLQGRW